MRQVIKLVRNFQHLLAVPATISQPAAQLADGSVFNLEPKSRIIESSSAELQVLRAGITITGVRKIAESFFERGKLKGASRTLWY